jgi:RNA recognition motif-containing protein
VQGLPWKYTWKELKPLFEECGPISRADVVFGRDGRSRVGVHGSTEMSILFMAAK